MSNTRPNAYGLLDFEWDAPLPDADRDRLLEKMAATVRKWRLEVPTILFLESHLPLNTLAGQGLIAFSPLVAPLLPGGLGDVQRLSQLLAHPENVRRLLDMLSQEEPSQEKPNAARER